MSEAKNDKKYESVMLTREQFLEQGLVLPIEKVSMPGKSVHVFVKTLKGKQRDEYENSCLTKKGNTNMVNARAKLAARTVCNEKGKTLFSESDIEQLGNVSSAWTGRIFDVAQRLNGFSDGDIDDLEKN